MDWELGFGGWLHPRVPSSPLPRTESSVFNMYKSNWIIFMVAGLKWVRAGSNIWWSREGRGVGIWQPAAGWDCHGVTGQPRWLCQGHTSFCQQEIETSLVLYRVLTTGLSNAVAGRKWLYIYSAWIYCLFANNDVWINSCFLVYAKIQTYWTDHNCRSSGISWVHSVRNS